MPLTQGLPISRLVSVSVSLTTPAIVAESVNSLLILGTSPVISVAERVRQYAGIAEVSADFGSSCEEYYAAAAWFSQNPSPSSVFIGRWAKVPVGASLIGGPLSTTEQNMLNWTGITNGGFIITIDNAAPKTVTGLSFAAMGSLNAVASAIQTQIAPATCIWNQNQDRFEIASSTTGSTSTLSHLSPPPTGTDISSKMHMSGAAGDGSFISAGQPAETQALTAVIACDLLFSAQWYGLVCPSATFGTAIAPGDHEAIAAYVEAGGIGGAGTPHYYGVTTQEPGTLVLASVVGGGDQDLAYRLFQHGYNKTATQFSTSLSPAPDSKPYAICSYLARILTTPWTGQNTTITEMYKQQPGIVPENVSTTQANALQSKNCNGYVNYSNAARLVQYGTSCSGQFTDTIIGADSLALDLQTAIFNVLYTTPTKVPQTDAGMQLLVNAAEATCAQYTANGWLGTGTWAAQGFGTLYTGKVLPEGWYVYAPSMLTQAQADRAARRAPLMQIAAKTAGAIHTSSIVVYVNQ